MSASQSASCSWSTAFHIAWMPGSTSFSQTRSALPLASMWTDTDAPPQKGSRNTVFSGSLPMTLAMAGAAYHLPPRYGVRVRTRTSVGFHPAFGSSVFVTSTGAIGVVSSSALSDSRERMFRTLSHSAELVGFQNS